MFEAPNQDVHCLKKKKKKESIANIVKSYLVVLLNCTQIYYLTVCELCIYI